MERKVADSARRERTALVVGISALMVLSVLGWAFFTLVLDFQASAQAYVAGESRWSKGVTTGIYHLERYAAASDPADLREARAGLQVPLSAMEAREALQQTPPDEQTARDAFLAAGNPPKVIPGLINLFKYFSWVPHFSRALDIWREADRPVKRLDRIASELHSLKINNGDPEKVAALRREINTLNIVLTDLAERFSTALLDSLYWFKGGLFLLAAIVVTGAALVIFLVFYQVMAWLRRGDRRFEATFQQAGIGMAQISPSGLIMDVNPALCATLVRGRDKLVGQHVQAILHPSDQGGLVEEDERLVAGSATSYTVRKRFVRGDGSTIWGKLTAAVTWRRDGSVEQFIWIIEDVTDAHHLARQLNYQARHDELTGLFNRREVENRLETVLEEAQNQNTHHVLCFIDVDQFKIVNDTCGHMAGDQLLRRIAAALESAVRHTDMVGRLGGDEFAVILHHTSLDDAVTMAEKLREKLSAIVFYWEDRSFRMTVTIGLAEINEFTSDVTAVLRAADTACHLAKDRGRDSVHAFTESDEAVVEHYSGLEWLNTIQKALDDDRLTLSAQMITPLQKESEDFNYEILVRLRDSHGNEHLPGTFMPAAERYGLVTMIDMRVIEKALAWLAANPRHMARLQSCHINVSAPSISNQKFHQFVARVLDRYPVDGTKICFEITETSAMANLADAWSFFDMVAEYGCCIALDDFGSGMSSFNYLKTLPASILKIDGAFVRDLNRDDTDMAVVRAIHEAARALGKVTVAECVESREVADKLRGLGVDYGQGFALHKPCPLDNFSDESLADRVADPSPDYRDGMTH
jgi:diguanylate cyclase (GGDEF)-like protein/PAS domain S-box-containing protein